MTETTKTQETETGLKPDGRYSRQELFAPIGRAGQTRIRAAQVTLIGCGALGSAQAEMMVRAGVGKLRIIDRDFVELSNLQRQMLFDEDDVAGNLPKAEAAARKLRRINSEVDIEPIVADVNPGTVRDFVSGAQLILDGTDNLITRYLINDVALSLGVPWIYGACVAARGLVLPVLPPGRPCLRCLFETPPEPGQMETCETVGIIGPIVTMVTAAQITEALKILSGCTEAVNRGLQCFEPWDNRSQTVVTEALTEGCAACRDGRYEFLDGKGSLSTISLCGRNAVQIRTRKQHPTLDLDELARRLRAAQTGEVFVNEFLLRLNLGSHEITVFPDARAIIKGTSNLDEARSLYARYVGH